MGAVVAAAVAALRVTPETRVIPETLEI